MGFVKVEQKNLIFSGYFPFFNVFNYYYLLATHISCVIINDFDQVYDFVKLLATSYQSNLLLI